MNYRKAILFHAYLLPIGGALLLAIILLVVPARFKASQEEKSLDYQALTTLNQQVNAIESRLKDTRDISKAWKESLDGEFVKSMNSLINGRLENLVGKQLEQESTGGRPDGGTGLSLQGAQPATRTKLQFRGGFEPMQETLLALESKLPQMQLESLGITEDENGDGLRFEMVYTVWEKSTSSSK